MSIYILIVTIPLIYIFDLAMYPYFWYVHFILTFVKIFLQEKQLETTLQKGKGVKNPLANEKRPRVSFLALFTILLHLFAKICVCVFLSVCPLLISSIGFQYYKCEIFYLEKRSTWGIEV
jgi:hypothetical protein